MDEKILILLTLEEIKNVNKGLKTAIEYINSKADGDKKLQYEIYNMLKKLEYVQYEYSEKNE